jgi:hypothetical protein
MSNEETKKLIEEVMYELVNARSKFPSFNSYHEGYAVLLEEVDELWDEVKKKQKPANYLELPHEMRMKFQNDNKIRAEAIQVAAMALRIIVDLCDNEETSYEP